jgi:hypothetical protein
VASTAKVDLYALKVANKDAACFVIRGMEPPALIDLVKADDREDGDVSYIELQIILKSLQGPRSRHWRPCRRYS